MPRGQPRRPADARIFTQPRGQVNVEKGHVEKGQGLADHSRVAIDSARDVKGHLNAQAQENKRPGIIRAQSSCFAERKLLA